MKKPWLEGLETIDVNKAVPPWWGWFETLALTTVVLAASFFTEQQDPFRLEGGFPWPVLAPLLAGLRYGFVYAFVSALLILAARSSARLQMSDDLGIKLSDRTQFACYGGKGALFPLNPCSGAGDVGERQQDPDHWLAFITFITFITFFVPSDAYQVDAANRGA